MYLCSAKFTIHNNNPTMKKALFFLLVTAFACIISTATASPVDKQKALTVATHFIQAQGGTDITLTDITATTPYTTFYIFAGNEGKGFVIVSADDCVPPILGYSTTNTFVTDDMPTHVKGWLNDYERQIKHYQKHNPQLERSYPHASPHDNLWDRLLEGSYTAPQNTAVAPLLSTTWNQSPYYNNLCPYSNYYGERTVTGCTATATAQVMKYWNHPTTGYGSHSYTHSTFGTLSANFGTTTYAWSSMPSQLTSSSTATQKTAVATLMYHVGVAIDMNYDVSANGGSGGASFANGDFSRPSAENALRTYFKYKSTLRQVSIDDYSSAEWSALLMDELDNSRPIIYTGFDSTAGHCFVCDGYSNSGQFHINWGWGGSCDGYYAFGYLNPAPGGTGGNATYTFNLNNVAIIGIEPNNSFGTTTTVTATSNNTSYGTVTGGGTYTGTNTNTVTLTATAASGCRFVGWNDEGQFSPRSFYANGGSYSFVANFEPLTGDTLGYCKNHCCTSFGATTGTTYWGIRLPASVLTAGHDLTKVMLYIKNAGSYTLTVYTGTTSPTTTALTQSFTAPSSLEGHWGVLTLSSPVIVDGTQSLWITLSSTASYPAAASYSSGNDDSRLWGSSFTPSTYNYSYMIRGIFVDNTPTPPTSGDTLSYCGSSAYTFSCGAGGSLTWGVKFPASMLTGHDYLTDVRLFVNESGTYNLTIYQGTTTSTTTQVATQSYTFGSAADSTWQNCHLTTPVTINTSQPLWVVFSNTGANYPASMCNYTGDTNSSLVYLGGAWMSIYTAAEGSFNGSWMIQAVTSSASSPSVLGDTVDYCGDSTLANNIGAGGSLTWGIRLPSEMHQHRQYLTDVMLYVQYASTYNLSIYQGSTTTSSTCSATQSATFTAADQGMWKTIHLATPVALNATQPLWIVFSNNSTSYPATLCNVTTDTNGSLVTLDGTNWISLYTASSGSLDGTWMIRAILSNSSTPSITISGPSTVGTGMAATFTVSGPASATYTWTLAGATPATATGTSVTATWSTPGTYNVIVSTTLSGTLLRDTLAVTVHGCTINSFPYTMGFENTDDLTCWNIIDNDNDGYSWDYTAVPHSGTQSFGSASYINNIGALTPDNWLVTPPIQLSSGHNYTLTWYDGAIDSAYYDEHYSVYISTTGNNASNFTGTPLFQTTLTTVSFTQRTIDLSSYAGQTVYIAFRHHNSTDVYWLLLDDITITQSNITNYTLTVLSDNPTMGTVSGGGTYPAGTSVTITATANAGYHFVQWNDGNTNASRTVTVTANATYTAYFAANPPDTYTLTVLSDNPTMGTVSGGGTYPAGTSVTITATANAGYHFVQWNDGNTNASRTVTVTANATYTAYFAANEPDTYTITALSANPEMGIVEGGGTYPVGTTVVLTARPFAGYHFIGWQDSDTTNPRTVTVTADATYIATFQADHTEGISTATAHYSVTALPGRIVSIVGADNQQIDIYDIVGRHICGTPKAASQCRFTLPHTGVYLISVGNTPIHRVVVIQ